MQEAHTARVYDWQKNGWSPFLVASIILVPARNCLKFTGLLKGEPVTLYSKTSVGLSDDLPFLIKKERFDEYKIASFKVVGSHASVFEIEIAAFSNLHDALINHRKTKALPKSSATVYKTVKTEGTKPEKPKAGKPKVKVLPSIPKVEKTKKAIKNTKRSLKNTSILRNKFHWLNDEYKVFKVRRVMETGDSRIKKAEGEMEEHPFEIYFQCKIQLSITTMIFVRESEFAFHELFTFYYDRRQQEYKYKKSSGYVSFQDLIDVEDRIAEYKARNG